MEPTPSAEIKAVPEKLKSGIDEMGNRYGAVDSRTGAQSHAGMAAISVLTHHLIWLISS